MRAILIDPFARTVTEIEVNDDGSLDSFRDVMKCEWIELSPLGSFQRVNQVLVLDEEGTFARDQRFFAMLGGNADAGSAAIFAGRAVIVGDAGHRFTATASPLSLVQAAVRWMSDDYSHEPGQPTMISCSDPMFVARILNPGFAMKGTG